MQRKILASLMAVSICLAMVLDIGATYCISPARAQDAFTSEAASGELAPPDLLPLPADGKPAVELELSEGVEQLEQAAPPNKIVVASSLPVQRLKELLKRLPAAEPQEKSTEFNIPFGVNPPPRPGKIVSLQFPPKEASLPAPAKAQQKVGALTVLRKSPEGSLEYARDLSVTFSQPMIPLTDAESDAITGNIPVHLTPQPAGKWRWQGTQTLVFQPDLKHLPRATVYKVEIPKGTKSVLGGTLASTVAWTITTPTVKLQSFSPDTTNDPSQPQHLDQMMMLQFNQEVDAQKVLSVVHVTEGKIAHSLRVATEQELKAQPAIAASIKSHPKGTCIAFKTTKPFAKKQQIIIAVGPGIPSKEGPLVGKDAWNYTFRTYWPLAVQTTNDSYSPTDAMGIEFNNPLNTKLFKKSMLSCKPAIEDMQVIANGNYLSIMGSLKAKSKYSVTLDKSLPDVFGQTLGSDKTVTIGVGDSQPMLNDPNQAMVIPQPNKSPSFSFTSTNIPQLRVNIYSANPSDYRQYLKAVNQYREWHQNADQYRDLQGFKSLSSKVLTVPKDSEKPYTETSVDLGPYLKNGLGNLIMTVERWPRRKDEIQRFPIWIQCTRIGLDAFNDNRTLVTHASRLEDGRPISDAQISTEGNPQLSGKTDKDGVSRIGMSSWIPQIVYCKSGDDQSFLTSNNYFWLQEPHQVINKDQLRWYSVTDRNLYRPGEKVQVKGWIRRFGSGPKGEISLISKSADSLNYQINDGNGNSLSKGDTKLDAHGGFTFGFDIPKNANLGMGYISLNANETNVDNSSSSLQFRIEEFRRPEFEMSVKSSKGNSMIFGETANLTASASYFSGGPLSDAPMHWNLRTSQSSFAPPGWSDFNFGKRSSYFSFYDFGRPTPIHYGEQKDFSLDGRTDSAGKHVLKINPKSLAEPYPVSIVAEGTVTDVNRQEWSDKATILLHPAQVYVGLKSSKQFYQSDEPIKLESIVADLDGKAVADQSLHIDVLKENSTWKEDRYETEEQMLASSDIKSESKPVLWLPEFKQGGSIKVRATVTDASGHKNKSEFSFWRAEKQPPEQKKVEQGKILVIADKKEYQPGETAELMIQAPFAAGRGVMTVRHNGISSSTPVSFSDSSGSIKVPINEEMMPNATIQIDLVGADCVYASGTVELSVPANSRRITLEVKPANSTLSPGGSTDISFNLKDASGKATANAQFAVAVVDESILALSGYNWQDPISVFYMNTSPATNDYHGRQLVVLNKKKPQPKREMREKSKMSPRTRAFGSLKPVPASMPAPTAAMRSGGGGAGGGMAMQDSFAGESAQLQGATNGTIGPQGADASSIDGGLSGGTLPKISIRSDFNAIAYFNPSMTTDENGNASCPVKLPDSLTRYRVMVVAVSGDRFFGKGEATLTARLPLMVRPSPPRFLNFGDHFELPVVLQNQTDKEMSVDLGLRATNLKFALKDAANSIVDGVDLLHNSGGNVLLPPNDRVEVRFPANTEIDGKATLDIAVVSDDSTDAANVSIPVYTPATAHAFAAYGQVDEGGAEQVVEMPKDVFDQIGGLELSTSSTQLQALTDAYIYIHDYSFLCSEQLSSRVLSTTALQDVLAAFNKMSAKEITEAKAQVQSDIKEVCKRQEDDGGFGLWKKGERDRWPFVSVQVTRALHEAKTRNYEVPEDVLARAKTYLRHIESHLPTRDYTEFTRRSIASYALFVRHLMKDSDPARARKLIQTALASYDLKREGMRRSSTLPAPGASQQDKLAQVLSLESIGWLLPVISADKNSADEVTLLRTVLASHIKETPSRAEIDDDSNGDNDYFLFYSNSRLNATILETMILDQPKSDLIPKLANSLLAHRRAGRWESTQENCSAMLALFRYFNTYEKVVPDFVANTWLGEQYIGQSKFVGRTTDTQVINVPMRFLESHQADKNVVISKTGKGRLYYRLALNYAPKNLLLGAYDNGFSVKRTYEAVDNPSDVKKDAQGVWHVKAGATVKSKLEIRTPGRRYHVALTDPFPAGMEPVNAALEGSRSMHPKQEEKPEQNLGVDEESGSGARAYFWYPWWDMNWYEHQNLRDFRAEAFTSSLYSGKYNYSYLMRATTPGDYIVPPTKVEEMYTPEVYGRAACERVIVE